MLTSNKKTTAIFGLTFGLTLLAFNGCASFPAGQDSMALSDPDEIAFGLQVKESIIKQFGEYKDPALRNYIEGVGNKVAGASERRLLPFNYTVLDTDMINSFSASVQYDENELKRQMKAQMDEAIKSDRMKPSEAMRLLDDYERGLKAYTYLSF